MSSFKVYLPSNACPDIYPNNTPTDYRINFDKPIELEGEWEVGAESICYASEIYDSAETASINMKAGNIIQPYINDVRPLRYHVTKDNKWMGFDGVTPKKFELDAINIDGVLSTLNSLNNEIVTSGKAFHFRCVENHIVCEVMDQGLFLYLSPRLIQLVGGMKEVIGAGETWMPYRRLSDKEKQKRYSDATIASMLGMGNDVLLKEEDYRIRYVHTSVQMKKSFPIKWPDSLYNSTNTLIESWKRSVPYIISLESDDGHVIITNHHANLAVDLSSRMRDALHQPMPIMKGNTKAPHPIRAEKPIGDINVYDLRNSDWYANIYTSDLRTVKKLDYKEHRIKIFPWESNSIRELLSTINDDVNKKLRQKMKRLYHRDHHRFSLRLQPSQHVSMKLGKHLEITFSANLAQVLGFHQYKYQKSLNIAEREVETLFNRSRQLHILSDIVKPTIVGSKQVQILRDFLHRRTKKSLRTKYFDIINYVPLTINRIDKLHMQLVNDTMQTVHLQDTKTLITLYFRKI